MNDKDIYMLCMITIIWLFVSIVYLFEKTKKVDVEINNNENEINEEKSCIVKRNFRTVHPDNRKNFKNLINDDGTPYVNEEFGCSRS